MIAVIRTGGHQYQIKQGDRIIVEKIEGNDGDKIKFADVIFASDDDKIISEKSSLSKVKVEGVIKAQTRDAKVIVFKYKRRKNYKRKKGHKQKKTMVEITSIQA